MAISKGKLRLVLVAQGSAEDAVSLRLRRTLHRICTKEASGLESVRGQYMRGPFSSRPLPGVAAADSTHLPAATHAMPALPLKVPSKQSIPQKVVPSPVVPPMATQVSSTKDGPKKKPSSGALSRSGFEAALSRITHSDRMEHLQSGAKALGEKLDTGVATAAGSFSGVGLSLVAGVERSARSASSMITSRSTPVSGVWSLVERSVAADTVVVAAAAVKKAKMGLVRGLPSEHASVVDVFYRTVEASEDVRDAILRAAARSALKLDELRPNIASTDYGVNEVPSGPSPWVAHAVREVSAFAARLTVAGVALSPATFIQLWHHGATHLAETMVEGLSRVATRCTSEGRGAMTVDVAEVTAAAATAAPTEPPSIPTSLRANMNVVNVWVKAFYTETDDELVKWAATHPEYSLEAVTALVTAVADFRGLSRAKRQALVHATTAAATAAASM